MADPVYDPKATTLPVLRYLVALAEHRHFGRAAEACHVAQPTLSAQLAAWERRMHLTVFERDPRGVRVTPAGERVVAAARAALAALRAVEDAASTAAAPFFGPVRMGVIPTIAPDALPWVVRAIERTHPDLDLPLREATTAELLAILGSGGIDVALLAHLPGIDQRHHWQPLYREPFLAALPRGHVLAREREVAPARLGEERLLLLDEGHCLRGQALELCHRAAAASGADYRATSLATLARLVAAGMGVTVLPALSAGSDGVVCRPISGQPDRVVGLAWRRDDPRADAYGLLAATIRKAAPREVVRPT